MVASAGNIGGWTINSGELASGSTHLYSLDQNSAVSIQSSTEKKDWHININNTFGVDKSGNLYANGSNLKELNANNITSGKITATYIDASDLQVKAANITGKLTASQINVGTLDVKDMKFNGTQVT